MNRHPLTAILLAAILTLATAPAGSGQCRLDASSRLAADRIVADSHKRAASRAAASKELTDSSTDAPRTYTPLIVQYDGQDALAAAVALGTVVFHTRADMALLCVPDDAMESFLRLPGILTARIGGKLTSLNDRSRQLTGVDAVHAAQWHSGTATASRDVLPYDGTGVVAGLCDIGFDPGHVAFRGRVGMMSVYNDTLATRMVYAPGTPMHTDGAVLAPDTDTDTHASHVAGTLAGSYAGNPYYGMAPGSTIAVSTSYLSEVCLLSGVEDIIAYAKSVGKPAVINLSMGSYMGPHNGTDLFNRYMDLLGQEAVIVLSAGNNGYHHDTIRHAFTDDGEQLGTMLESYKSWCGFNVDGSLEIWSADARRFEIQLVGWDQTDRRYVYQSDWLPLDNPDGDSFSVIAPGQDSGWDRWFPDSYFRLAYGNDPLNGRFVVSLNYSINPVDYLPGTPWARPVAGWRIRAARGVEVDVYTDGISSFLRNYGVPGMTDGTSDQSISNLSCNQNTITVGSWNSRNTVPVLDGEPNVYSFTEGTVTNWSSYGTLRDGRRLPHVNAPGNYLVSAMNSTYLAAHPDEWILSHKETVDGRDHYWFSQCGTSMSAPTAAGVFALWLQANPALGVDSVRDIAMKTARTDFADIADPRWGAGALDAAAGLRLVTGDNASVDNVDNIVSPADWAVSVADRTVTVTRNGQSIAFALYNMQGIALPAHTSLAPGLYIVAADGHTRRVLVK